MWEQYAAGYHREHWRLIHDRLNGLAPMNPGPHHEISEEDRKLQEHAAKHGGCC